MRCSLSGSESDPEKPLLVSSFYLFRYVEDLSGFLALSLCASTNNLGGRHGQVGSLAGAAHLLNGNAGVLR
jgi:hypothetical protein